MWMNVALEDYVEEAEGDQKLYLPLRDYDHLSKILTRQLTISHAALAMQCARHSLRLVSA